MWTESPMNSAMAQTTPQLNPEPAGRQLLIELYGCDSTFLDSVSSVEEALVEAARAAGATIVESVFHHFSPHGVSGVVVIAESHVAVHTWPEHGYAALDVFTCGASVEPTDIMRALEKNFSAQRSESKLILRGPRVESGQEPGRTALSS